MSFEHLKLEDLAAPVRNAMVGGPFGSNLVSKDYTEAGVPVIRGQNMGDRWVGGDFVFVSPEKAKTLSQNTARPGDLVFTQRGTLGQVSIVPQGKYDEYIVSQSQMKLTPDLTKADVDFLYYLFNSSEQLQYIKNVSIQTGVPHTNLGILRKTPVTIPALKQQRLIASMLGSLDDRITLLSETNATLEAIAQALFKSWFVDFDPVRARMEGRAPEGMDEATAALFPDGFEESALGLVPRGWQVGTLTDIMGIQGGTQPPASEFKDEWEDGYTRLLQIRDFSQDNHITYIPTTKKLRFVDEDDVLIGRYGSGSGDRERDSLGRFLRGLTGAINVAIVKALPAKDIYREWIAQYVRSGRFYDAIVGGSARAVQAGFKQEDLNYIRLSIAPDEIYSAFEEIGLAFWTRSKGLQHHIKTLTTLRDTLLPRLISGQLRLPEAEALLEEACA